LCRAFIGKAEKYAENEECDFVFHDNLILTNNRDEDFYYNVGAEQDFFGFSSVRRYG